MAPSTTMTKTQSSGTASRGSKAKPSRLVVLKLPSTHLSTFSSPSSTPKPENDTSAAASATPQSSSDDNPPVPETKAPTPPETIPESSPNTKNDTASAGEPEVSVKAAPAAPPVKRRGNFGPRAGTKRSFGAMTADGLPKPRAKPGPKKRMRIDNGLAPDGTNRPWTTPGPSNGQKLGPKANTGAINAGLRALDRTGTPCRKWEKKGFCVKSFTGIVWDLPSWKTPKKVTLNGKDSTGTPNSNDENHVVGSSNANGSEASNSGRAPSVPTASSPTPAIAATG